MKNRNIGLMGLDFYDGNKGCAALAYSFLDILIRIARERKRKLHLIIISDYSESEIPMPSEYITYHFQQFRIKKISEFLQCLKKLKSCDIVFDFTKGDSFSDLYGWKRFFNNTLLKQYVVSQKIPLILGPQTFGPFRHTFARIWAAHIIKASKSVFARDTMSRDYAEKIARRRIDQTVDVAFALPYEPSPDLRSQSTKIGFNISGLLWEGGYTGSNQFGLRVNYQEYCKRIISLAAIEEI